MTDKRAAALHEAGHALALFHFGLLDDEGAQILRDRGGEYVGVTMFEQPDDLTAEEGQVVAMLCGYYAEVAFDRSRREQAMTGASHDFERVETVLDAEYGPAAPFHLSRLRTQARRFVRRHLPLVYGLARELEDHGQVTRAHAEELVGTLRGEQEAQARLFARWRRLEQRRPPGRCRVGGRARARG